LKEGWEQEFIQRTFHSGPDKPSGNVSSLGKIMSNPLHRAERFLDLSEECRAVAARCASSTEMRIHYSQMSEHYRKLAEAEELSALAYGR
jgi:hypothetical protein